MPGQCFLLSPITSFVRSKRIRSFHYHMFHGHGARDGVQWPMKPGAFLANDLRTPLKVVREGSRIPSVYCPIGVGSLVVIGEVANQIRSFQNIELLEVVYTKLVEQEWVEGDFSWYEPLHDTDPEQYLDSLPDVPQLHKAVEACFEIIVARLRDIDAKVLGEQANTVSVGEPPKEEVTLSDALIEAFPIIWCPAGWLLSAHAYSVLDRYLDRDYFDVSKVEF